MNAIVVRVQSDKFEAVQKFKNQRKCLKWLNTLRQTFNGLKIEICEEC